MFPVQNIEERESREGLGMGDERPSRRGATSARPDEGEHDFASSTDRFFQRSGGASGKATTKGPPVAAFGEGGQDRDFGSSTGSYFRHSSAAAQPPLEKRARGDSSLDRAEAKATDFGSTSASLFGVAPQQDEAHRMCGVVANLLKSRGVLGEESAEDVCQSVSGADQTSCNFFVRAFGSDILQKLGEESIDDICDELDYGKTAPSRSHDQSDATKLDNLRGAEEARRTRGGDPTRDRAPTADLDEGARALSMNRARTPWGSSAGLNKGGRSMPVVSAAQQKEVGWDSVDPHEEGHPAASSGRAGLKGLGVNTEGQ